MGPNSQMVVYVDPLGDLELGAETPKIRTRTASEFGRLRLPVPLL